MTSALGSRSASRPTSFTLNLKPPRMWEGLPARAFAQARRSLRPATSIAWTLPASLPWTLSNSNTSNCGTSPGKLGASANPAERLAALNPRRGFASSRGALDSAASAAGPSTANAASGTASDSSGARLESLPWAHTLIHELPADPDSRNVVRQVEGALFSFVSPTPATGVPYLISYSSKVARLVGLEPSECERPEFPLLMSGAAPLPGARPYAACYGGHQFGVWAGQLGDGRAITLGEVVDPASGQRWELQLKGAGKTPYSRRADGRAVLRSSLREFVASEAMAALGVPTTRALSLVVTGDRVLRDMFYNGNARWEVGAVVCRVAPSFLRFGTFQLPVSRGAGELGSVKTAADWLIKYHYPELAADPHGPYLALLGEVTRRTGRLVAAWQALGFVHGVLNTDNMSLLGLTIDYGPFGFLDKFDPDWTPNLTDSGRRYSFRNQPEAVQFNLVMLANALLAADLVPRAGAQEVLEEYSKVLSESYNERMAAKLGLREYDKTLTHELMRLMYDDDADFTNTFRALCSVSSAEVDGEDAVRSGSAGSVGPAGLPAALAAAINGGKPLSEERAAAWRQWLQAYRARLRADGLPEPQRQAIQRSACPKFIPRQHLLQWAIDAAEGGDYSELEALMEVLERPYDEQPDALVKYSALPPEEMLQRPGVCMLSCSS